VSVATRAETCCGLIVNDYDLDEEHNWSDNGRSCVGHFVWCYPI